MSKLGELHREEKKAQLEVEKAEKDAQKIRMSIPDLLAEQSIEKEMQLTIFIRVA